MTTATRTAWRPRWVLAFLAAVLAVAAGLFATGPASAATPPAAETRVGASHLAAGTVVGPSAGITAGQRLGNDPPPPGIVVATGVAAEAGAGAENVANGVRLRAQLTGEEIAGGHAFDKHVVELGEFPGVANRSQFAAVVEDVVTNGEMRTLSGGRTGYWQNGTVVIRNPGAVDGGTAFRPKTGYDYFLNTLH